MSCLFKCFSSRKGSVLVFSLIILALMLVSALSVSLVSVSERKSAAITERANRSFQVADSGVELVLQGIYKGSFATLNALAASLGTTCNANGEVTAALNSGRYTISFFDLAGTKFTSTDCASTTWRDRLVRIKSEGASGNTVRVVEVAVEAPGNFVGWWAFDSADVSGTTVLDRSGRGHNGTLTNGASVSSQAVTFDGSNDYVNVGNLGTRPLIGAIAFWMNAAVIANYNNPFTTNYLGGNVGFRFEENSMGKFYAVVGNDVGSYGTEHTFLASGLQANTWYHVVLVWDSGANKVVGYLNGAQKFSDAHTTWPTALSNVAIGNGFSSTRYWKGSVDEVRIYNRSLSSSEVSDLYNLGH